MKRLLEQHTLVVAQRLVEGRDPHRFLTGDLNGGIPFTLNLQLHTVARHEAVAFTLEGERPVFQGDAKNADDRVGRPVGESHVPDERNRLRRRQTPHSPEGVSGIEYVRQVLLGGRPRILCANAFPLAATADTTANQQYHC